MRALIANEPRTYREALVDALRAFRPQVEVSTVEPHGLAAEIERLRPHLVVCSWLSVVMPSGPLSWVVLYPHEENRAEAFTAGEHATIAGIRFSDLLAIVDETLVFVSGAATEGHRRDVVGIPAATNESEQFLEQGS